MAVTATVGQALRRVPILPLYFLALIPALWLLYDALNGRLGADPVRELEHGLGIWAFRFMMATLAVTPMRDWTGLNLLRFRRFLGLTTFYYAIMHLAVYLVLDRQLAWTEIVVDLTRRPYVIAGTAALLLLTPLALTSTNWAIRRMGSRNWQALHRLAYPAAIFMVLHYLWLVKSWTLEPLAYAAGMAVLLALRWNKRVSTRHRAGRSGPAPAG